jgi:hypothetical protein
VVRRAARACALTARAAGDRTAARVQHELALPVPSPAGSVSVGERLLDRVGQLLEQPPAYTA